MSLLLAFGEAIATIEKKRIVQEGFGPLPPALLSSILLEQMLFAPLFHLIVGECDEAANRFCKFLFFLFDKVQNT